MRETRTLEFKETITNTFLKTVSAFSNYDGGTIYFGIDDDGNIKGLKDVKQACLDIENKINDSISPQPNYTLEIQNNDQTIKLTVKSGICTNQRLSNEMIQRQLKQTPWNYPDLYWKEKISALKSCHADSRNCLLKFCIES